MAQRQNNKQRTWLWLVSLPCHELVSFVWLLYTGWVFSKLDFDSSIALRTFFKEEFEQKNTCKGAKEEDCMEGEIEHDLKFPFRDARLGDSADGPLNSWWSNHWMNFEHSSFLPQRSPGRVSSVMYQHATFLHLGKWVLKGALHGPLEYPQQRRTTRCVCECTHVYWGW